MNTLSSFGRKFKYGFTLIELLLVIGIIAILAAIVIVAINPTKQLGDARDSQRRSDVNTLLNAVYQYAIDNNGSLPDGLSGGTVARTQVCGDSTGSCSGLVSLTSLTGSYLTAIPVDPRFASGTTNEYSGYFVTVTSAGRVTFESPLCENEDGDCPTVTR